MAHLILAPPLKISSASGIFFRHGPRNLILSCPMSTTCRGSTIDESLWSLFHDFIPRSSSMPKMYYRSTIDDQVCRSKNFRSLRFSSDITDPEQCIDDRRSRFIRCVDVSVFLFVLPRCRWCIDEILTTSSQDIISDRRTHSSILPMSMIHR
jgi:hypothetical protein